MTIYCPKCPESFTRPSSLNRHLRCKHAEDKHMYQCSQCFKRFARPDILRRHEQNHHADGMAPCTTCSRPFRKDYLKQHSTTCSAEHPPAAGRVLRGMVPLDLDTMDTSWRDLDSDMYKKIDLPSNLADQIQGYLTDEASTRDHESSGASATSCNSSIEGGLHPSCGRRLDKTTAPTFVTDKDPVHVQQTEGNHLWTIFDYDQFGRVNMDLAQAGLTSIPPPPLAWEDTIKQLQVDWPRLHLQIVMFPRTVLGPRNNDLAHVTSLSDSSLPKPVTRHLQYYPCALLQCCTTGRVIEVKERDLTVAIETHILEANHIDSAFSELKHCLTGYSHLIGVAMSALTTGDVAKFQGARQSFRRELHIPANRNTLNRLDQVLFDSANLRLFQLASVSDSSGMTKYLLESGLDSNKTDENDQNPLHWACASGIVSTAALLYHHNFELLSRKDKRGSRPLDIAMARGHRDLAIDLVRYASQEPYESRSPLQLCCRYGNAAILKEFLERGERMGRDDALEVALNDGTAEMVQLLLGAGATINVVNDTFVDAVRGDTCPEAIEKLLLLYQHGQPVR